MNHDAPGRNWMRWVARILGTLAGAFWLFAVSLSLFSGLAEEPPSWTAEGAILAVLAIVSAAGVVVAWAREDIGGPILVGCGCVLSLYAFVTAGHNKAFAVAITGVPFALAGILHWLSARRRILR
jgi:hypothetical protein